MDIDNNYTTITSNTKRRNKKTPPWGRERLYFPYTNQLRFARGLRFGTAFGSRHGDGASWDDSGDGVFIHHLRHRISKEDHVLVEGLNLPLQLDAIDQIDRDRDVFPTKHVEERIL